MTCYYMIGQIPFAYVRKLYGSLITFRYMNMEDEEGSKTVKKGKFVDKHLKMYILNLFISKYS